MMKNWKTIAEDCGGSDHRLVRDGRCNCRRRTNRVNASLVEEIV